MTAYPRLHDFLAAWFHQDFHYDGDVPDVIAKFGRTAAPNEVATIRQDIQQFLADNPGDADAAFTQTFHPDITPSGWNMTAREWLAWVDRLLGELPSNT